MPDYRSSVTLMKVNPGTRLGKGFVDFFKKSTNPSGNKA